MFWVQPAFRFATTGGEVNVRDKDRTAGLVAQPVPVVSGGSCEGRGDIEVFHDGFESGGDSRAGLAGDGGRLFQFPELVSGEL